MASKIFAAVPSIMRPKDSELLEHWRDGNSASGEELFERYYDAVERFFLSKVTSAAEDLVQETFKRCVEAHARIRHDGQFREFLFGIAVNVLNSYLRNVYRNGNPIDIDECPISDLEPGPGTLADRHREHRILLEGLRKIPVNDQVILELFYWERFKHREIAKVLKIPAASARRRLGEARQKLEAVMRELAKSPEELTSTLTQLDDWARNVRS